MRTILSHAVRKKTLLLERGSWNILWSQLSTLSLHSLLTAAQTGLFLNGQMHPHRPGESSKIHGQAVEILQVSRKSFWPIRDWGSCSSLLWANWWWVAQLQTSLLQWEFNAAPNLLLAWLTWSNGTQGGQFTPHRAVTITLGEGGNSFCSDCHYSVVQWILIQNPFPLGYISFLRDFFFTSRVME